MAKSNKPKGRAHKPPAKSKAKTSKKLAAIEHRFLAKNRLFVRFHIDFSRYGKKATFEYFPAGAGEKAKHDIGSMNDWKDGIERNVLVQVQGEGNPIAYEDLEIVMCKTVRITSRDGGNKFPEASVSILESYLDDDLLVSADIVPVSGDDSSTGKLDKDQVITVGRFKLTDANSPLFHEVELQAQAKLKVDVNGDGTLDEDRIFLVDPGIIIVPKRP